MPFANGGCAATLILLIHRYALHVYSTIWYAWKYWSAQNNYRTTIGNYSPDRHGVYIDSHWIAINFSHVVRVDGYIYVYIKLCNVYMLYSLLLFLYSNLTEKKVNVSRHGQKLQFLNIFLFSTSQDIFFICKTCRKIREKYRIRKIWEKAFNLLKFFK